MLLELTIPDSAEAVVVPVMTMWKLQNAMQCKNTLRNIEHLHFTGGPPIDTGGCGGGLRALGAFISGVTSRLGMNDALPLPSASVDAIVPEPAGTVAVTPASPLTTVDGCAAAARRSRYAAISMRVGCDPAEPTEARASACGSVCVRRIAADDAVAVAAC